jgi:hypothetical protein
VLDLALSASPSGQQPGYGAALTRARPDASPRSTVTAYDQLNVFVESGKSEAQPAATSRSAS